ncbi:MAG: alanine--glyoxylate aminotransferase family protein, partial [Desulfurococcales archaeon]|nr:alanine--glyoxylate aminotransferase family protein [Desulfurococcales archaeon]
LGSKTIIVESELGYGFTSKDLDRLLEKNKEIEAIALQHVDTSTSVANPVKELARVAKEWGLRILVDGVAAIGGMEMKMDEWGVDVCFTGSQKALGVPPGLGIIAYSKSFSEELDSEEKPISLFFNIKALLKEMESTKNYYLTPAVNLVYALDKATDLIEEEGLEKRYERHKIMAETVRAAIKELDLKLVAKEGFYADTVTAVYLPERVEWPQLYNTMRYSGVEIAGGLGDLKGKIFRIGHMGQVGYNEILTTIAALERSLLKLGYRVRLGEALTVIQERYLRAGI